MYFCMLQSRTKLLEKVFPIMSTFLRNKTLRKENPFPQFNVASHKRLGIRLSFEYTTTLLSGEGGEGRTGTATMFRKVLSKYTIFSTVLSKIVVWIHCFSRRVALLRYPWNSIHKTNAQKNRLLGHGAWYTCENNCIMCILPIPWV